MVINYTNLNENINIYFREIRNFTSLTREDEVRLFSRIKTGDKSAQTEIFNRMAKLAVNIAKTYTGDADLLEDLIQEANIGILTAIDKFDLNSGFRFSSYARYWMKAAISKYLDEMGVVRHCNPRLIDLANKIREKFYKENQRDITNVELMDMLEDAGEVVDDVKSITTITNVRIDLPYDCDDSGKPKGEYGDFADRTASDNGFTEKERAEELSEDIRRRLSRLTQREQQLVLLMYGFVTGEEMGYDAVTERWNEGKPEKEQLTQERIRQIIKGALKKMK